MKHNFSRLLILAAMLVAVMCLWAEPTKSLKAMEAESATIADNLDKLCEQAVNMQTPKQAVSLVKALYKPLSEMVILDARANKLSQQSGNVDDKDLWNSLLANLRRMGIALETIEKELDRFRDDPDVQLAYEELDQKMTKVIEKNQEQ